MLGCLNSYNVRFLCYRIVHWNNTVGNSVDQIGTFCIELL